MALRFVRRTSGAEEKASAPAPPSKASKVFAAVPALWEFVTASAWDDGQERVTGTILIFVEDGRVKLCLNDRDGDCVAFVSGLTFEEALSSANEGLEGDTLDWRRSKRSGGQKGRR